MVNRMTEFSILQPGVGTSAISLMQTKAVEKSGRKKISVVVVGALLLGLLLPVVDASPPRAVATELLCTFQKSTWSGVMAQDVDYHDGNIYVAISSGNMNSPPSHSLKISSDGGSTWSEKTASAGTYTSADVVHIGPEGKIYLGQPWPGSSSTTTSISSDGGNSWSQLSQWATKAVATEGSSVYIASGNGFYVSRNSGSSFTYKSLGPPPWPNSLKAVAVLGSDVYVAGTGGLYHSSDSGTSFRHTSLTGTAEGALAPVKGVTATTSGIYATTNSGVFKSVDKGVTWETVSEGVGASPGAIVADGNNVYVGSSAGLHVSTDAGGSYTTMTMANGLANNSVRSLALNGSSVYATHAWYTGSWNGGFSVAHNCPSSESAPSQVTGVSATPGDREVALAWTAPEDGGVAITDYVIETSLDAGGTWATVTDGVSTATASTISPLANGTSVLFKVAAVNSVGTGNASDAVSAIPQATVRFDANSGSGDMTSQSVAGSAALTSNSFSRQAYSFAGWNTAADGSGTSFEDGASYDFSGDLTLYAQWATTVTFDPNSGSGEMANQSAGGAAALTSNAFDPPSGFTFTGWNTAADGSGTAYANGASYDFSGSLTLYAQWTAVAAPPPSSDGGTSSGSVAVQSDPAPTRAVVVVPRRAQVAPPAASPAVIQRTQQSSGSSQPAEAVALVGGEEVAVTATTQSSQAASYGVGKVTVDIGVAAKDGVVDSVSGVPSLKIARNSPASVRGSGLRPNSTLQVFLPASDGSFIELPSVVVAADGSFDGSLTLGTSGRSMPMPIGKNSIQMVGFDDEGNETVLDIPVTIAQPLPAPEINRVSGERPALTPGQALAFNAGAPEIVTMKRSSAATSVEGEDWAFTVAVSTTDESGQTLAFTRDAPVTFSGEGFMPGTRADVWLFSDPTLVGTVDIAADGTFTANFAVDSNFVPTGDHTLQIQGVGEDGFVRAANLGVVVEDQVSTPLAPIDSDPMSWVPLMLIGTSVGGVLVLVGVTLAIRRGKRAKERLVPISI